MDRGKDQLLIYLEVRRFIRLLSFVTGLIGLRNKAQMVSFLMIGDMTLQKKIFVISSDGIRIIMKI